MENKKENKTRLGILCAGICLIFEPWLNNNLLHAIWALCLIMGIWFSMDVLTYSAQPKWWIGQAFFIYCAHSFLLEALEKLWLMIGGRTVFAAAIDYFLMPVIVIVILCITAAILDKYCRGIYSLLTGGRVNGKI